jgi:hypothetical protein
MTKLGSMELIFMVKVSQNTEFDQNGSGIRKVDFWIVASQSSSLVDDDSTFNGLKWMSLELLFIN